VAEDAERLGTDPQGRTPSSKRRPAVVAVIREFLSALPAGWVWLAPVRAADGAVTDFRVDAVSGGDHASGQAVERIGGLLSGSRPGLADGPVWQLYLQVMATGLPGRVVDVGDGEAARSEVVARRVHGGLLVWSERVDGTRRRPGRTGADGDVGTAGTGLRTVDRSSGPVLPLNTPDAGSGREVTMRMGLVTNARVMSEVPRDAIVGRLRRRYLTLPVVAQSAHRVAARVQDMIQPVPLVPFRLADLDAVVLYAPADRFARVGGDWYCAQGLPDGRVALAIGDVAGHGLDAATGMAHVRFSLIAWLSIGILDPGTLLGHLNTLCARLGITGTAMVAVYDPADRALSWARAGHPPPLLARAGTVLELAQPAGVLLGIDADLTHPVVATHLRVDDLVVLYTDGLVERRPDDTEQPLDQIKRTLSQMSAVRQGPTHASMRGLLPRANPDDICVVALRVRATP
jgi:hypothetical protein